MGWASKGRSIRNVAELLNDRGITTPLGGKWHETSVRRLLGRLDEASEGTLRE